MILVKNEVRLEDFQFWQGAIPVMEFIQEHNKVDELTGLINELHTEGIDSTELNDLLWFDTEQVMYLIGLETEWEGQNNAD